MPRPPWVGYAPSTNPWERMYGRTQRPGQDFNAQDYVVTCVARNARITFGTMRRAGEGLIPLIQMYECSSCGTFRAQGVCRCYCLSSNTTI